MNKEMLLKVKKYLENEGIINITNEVTEMDLRKKGKVYSREEHLRGIIYSLMSAQTVWVNIERNKPNIDKIFYEYDFDKILDTEYEYFVQKLGEIRCRSRLTNAQMKALHENISTLKRIEKDFGSIDAFVTMEPTEKVIELLTSSSSKYKIKQMGEALAREYLRNVGVDSCKPDVHIKRLLGKERLGSSYNINATNNEVIIVMKKLSEETGLWMAQIDYILWAYCATDMGEICTANPKCSCCVLKDKCNYCK